MDIRDSVDLVQHRDSVDLVQHRDSVVIPDSQVYLASLVLVASQE